MAHIYLIFSPVGDSETFFFQLKLQKETSSVILQWREEAGHRDTSEQIRTEVQDNTIFN